MPVSEETYRRVALEDPEGRWELVCSRLRRKPAMTTEHEGVIDALYTMLARQLDRGEFRMRANSRLRLVSGDYRLPDLFVLPRVAEERLRANPGTFEIYADPMPLVVEVWSPSTGDYDIDSKFPVYQERGDEEIWRIHPFERTLAAWRRQPDGGYVATTYTGGTIQPVALPGVTIDLDALFDL